MTNIFIIALITQGLFAKTYGGSNYDRSAFAVQTTDGGYAVAGWSQSFGAGNGDFMVLRLASDGSLIWARTIGGGNADWAYSLVQTTDGGFAVAGLTYSFGSGGSDCFVIKLSSSGSLDWARTYGGTGSDAAYSIVQTADGGYAVVGATDSYGAGNSDFLLLKLNSDGSLAWAKTYGGAARDEAWSIIQTPDGGFAVLGWSWSFSVGSSDFLLLKLDAAGSISWARTYGGDSTEWGYSIIRTSDGGYAIGGNSYSLSQQSVVVIKLNASGDTLWGKRFGGNALRTLIQTSDGGYAIAGAHSNFPIYKLDASGNFSWARLFGGSGDFAYSVVQTSDGGYALAGEVSSHGAGLLDFMVLKLDRNGNYPGCVSSYSSTVSNRSFTVTSPSVIDGAPTPTTTTPSPTITTPSLTITDACLPVDLDEGNPSGTGPRIICSPRPGGVLFVSPWALSIKIYAVDGRIAYSGNLKEGENLITLGRGVYIWTAGQYRGRVAIR
jgi:uncharacterized delta-60 repeat protein